MYVVTFFMFDFYFFCCWLVYFYSVGILATQTLPNLLNKICKLEATSVVDPWIVELEGAFEILWPDLVLQLKGQKPREAKGFAWRTEIGNNWGGAFSNTVLLLHTLQSLSTLVLRLSFNTTSLVSLCVCICMCAYIHMYMKYIFIDMNCYLIYGQT